MFCFAKLGSAHICSQKGCSLLHRLHVLLHFSFLLHQITCKGLCGDGSVAFCHHRSAPLRPLSCSVLQSKRRDLCSGFCWPSFLMGPSQSCCQRGLHGIEGMGTNTEAQGRRWFLSVPARGSQQSLLPFPLSSSYVILIFVFLQD